jgi:hypothetical protein
VFGPRRREQPAFRGDGRCQMTPAVDDQTELLLSSRRPKVPSDQDAEGMRTWPLATA